jgi:hypothetical protein
MPEKMEEGSFSQPNINVRGSRLVAAPSSPTLERVVAEPSYTWLSAELPSSPSALYFQTRCI